MTVKLTQGNRTMSKFVKLLVKEMEQRGITQRELSERAGVSRVQLSRVIHGISDPTVSWIAQVLAVMDLEIVIAKR